MPTRCGQPRWHQRFQRSPQCQQGLCSGDVARRCDTALQTGGMWSGTCWHLEWAGVLLMLDMSRYAAHGCKCKHCCFFCKYCCFVLGAGRRDAHANMMQALHCTALRRQPQKRSCIRGVSHCVRMCPHFRPPPPQLRAGELQLSGGCCCCLSATRSVGFGVCIPIGMVHG